MPNRAARDKLEEDANGVSLVVTTEVRHNILQGALKIVRRTINTDLVLKILHEVDFLLKGLHLSTQAIVERGRDLQLLHTRVLNNNKMYRGCTQSSPRCP